MIVVPVIVLLAVACSTVFLAVRLSSLRPSASMQGPWYDLYDHAFLAGGPGRVADTAIAAMVADGRLAVGRPGVASLLPGATARHAVEQAMVVSVGTAPSGALHLLRSGVMRSAEVQGVGDKLAAHGLLVHRDTLRPVRRHASIQAFCCLFGFLPVILIAAAAGAVVALALPVLVIGAVAAGVLIAQTNARLSRAGRDTLLRLNLGTAHLTGDAAVLVARRGIAAYPNRALRKILVRAARTSAPGARSGGSDNGASYDFAVVNWCGGGGGSCGGSSCGGSSCGGSSGSSCGGSSGSSCGGGGGGGGCSGGGGGGGGD